MGRGNAITIAFFWRLSKTVALLRQSSDKRKGGGQGERDQQADRAFDAQHGSGGFQGLALVSPAVVPITQKPLSFIHIPILEPQPMAIAM